MPINRNISKRVNINPNIIKTQISKKIANSTHIQSNNLNKNIYPPIKRMAGKRVIHMPNPDLIPKIWNNETVYIVGGGPSLKDFDWSLLKDKHVITLNRAYEVLPDAEVLYWTDARFYRWNKSAIDSLKSLKITCRRVPTLAEEIILVHTQGKTGLDKRNRYIKPGSNSGFAAINVAYHLGAKRIYLLGYDMTSAAGNTHWHDGYNINHNNEIYKKTMINDFDGIAEILRQEGISIYNANPDSALLSIPKCTIEQALSNSPV